MIFDELTTITHSLNDLKRKTEIKNNKALQDNTDAKYRLILSQTNAFVATIDYLYSDVSVEKSSEILTATGSLLTNLEKVTESGLANQDEVTKAETEYKTLQLSMKKEWAKQYSSITSSTISTLEAIRSIDSENVSSCLQKIQSAENWDIGVDRYKTMVKGKENADLLIQKLGLDDEIINFLQNANSNKATLNDLNDKVLAWLRSEKLESKIRISFVKK